MMKQQPKYIILILLLAAVGTLCAMAQSYRYSSRNGLHRQTARAVSSHRFGGYVDAGYSAMHNNVSAVSPLAPGGYVTSAGLTYEYDHRGMLFIHTGLGVRWQSVTSQVDDMSMQDANVYDTQGYQYTLLYNFDKRSDQSRILYVQLPVMIGSHVQSFYYMAGFKLQLPVWGQTDVRLSCTTSGIYKQFAGLGEGGLQEMDNHGFRSDVPLERTGQAGLAGTGGGLADRKCDILASAELGWEWVIREQKARRDLTKRDTRLRLSAYADYGLLNQNMNATLPLYDVPADYKWDFTKFEFNHVFSTSQTSGSYIRNLFVGVRFTALISVTK